MDEESSCLLKNETWEIVPAPKDRSPVYPEVHPVNGYLKLKGQRTKGWTGIRQDSSLEDSLRNTKLTMTRFSHLSFHGQPSEPY